MKRSKETPAQSQSFALIAPRGRPVVRILDLLFWACVVASLALCTVAFIVHHAFGWQAYLVAGIDYWFYFSVLFGPILFLTRRPAARFLSTLPGSRTLTLLVSMFLLCGLEEFTCFLTGTGLWEHQPRQAFLPRWFFGTAVLMTWGAFTVLMMRLLKLYRKEALYVGGLAGWIQESFLFQPRFFFAPLLMTALSPLIAFTYMQLIIWPLGMYPDEPRRDLPAKKLLLRNVGALVGILALESAAAWAMYGLIMVR